MDWGSGVCILTSSPYAQSFIFEPALTIDRHKTPLWIGAGFAPPADDAPLAVPRVSGPKAVGFMDKR